MAASFETDIIKRCKMSAVSLILNESCYLARILKSVVGGDTVVELITAVRLIRLVNK